MSHKSLLHLNLPCCVVYTKYLPFMSRNMNSNRFICFKRIRITLQEFLVRHQNISRTSIKINVLKSECAISINQGDLGFIII